MINSPIMIIAINFEEKDRQTKPFCSFQLFTEMEKKVFIFPILKYSGKYTSYYNGRLCTDQRLSTTEIKKYIFPLT